MGKCSDPGALAGATEAGGDQVRGDELSDATNSRVGPDLPESLAVIGQYKLLRWDPCEWATGRVGIATVLLPSGKLGGFAIYNLDEQFAEWWPTSRLRRVVRRDWRELNAARRPALALVRLHDPRSL